MKNRLYIFAVALVLGAVSCTNDALKPAAEGEQGDRAVQFGVYTNATKSTSLAEAGVKAGGIGVFAIYQGRYDLATYLEAKKGYEPNFMYNQKLEWLAGDWTYSPIKYWPNNQGEMVSFFAYAPYTDYFNDEANAVTPDSNLMLRYVAPSTDEGLRLQLGYDYMGPGIEYFMNEDPTKGVDLMWGAKQSASTCPCNLTKPSIGDKIHFQMKHALSRLDFDVQVWTDAVAGGSDPNNEIPEYTTVTIKSVTLKGNFASRGTLRLYDGTWNPDVETFRFLSFKSGRSQFNPTVEAGLTGAQTQAAALPLLAGTAADPGKNNYVMAIPGARFYFEIVYDVTTVDSVNPQNTSTITNTVCSTDGNAGHVNSTDGWYTIEQGKAYMFHLTIGLKTINFDAVLTPWQDETQTDIELP